MATKKRDTSNDKLVVIQQDREQAFSGLMKAMKMADKAKKMGIREVEVVVITEYGATRY